ncbi:MAG: M2 family metallopeptidase [Acidobacteriota bacterium]
MKKISFLIVIIAIIILFLISGENMKPDEKSFSEFIKNHTAKIEPLYKDINLAYWDASAFGKKEDYDRYGELQLKLRQIYSDREEFSILKELKASNNIKDPILLRQLEILYNSYLENQIEPALLKQIVELSTKVENQFNVFRGKMDGKELTMNQIKDILKTELNSEIRKKAWEASKQVGSVVESDLKYLVKLRDKAAKDLGFKNYYIMSLTLAEQNEEDLLKIFDELKHLTDEPFRELKNEIDGVLSKRYEIKIERVMPWHYQDPFFQDPPNIYKVDLDKYYSKQNIPELAKRFYGGLELPVEDILARSDLFEREKKYPHAYSNDIDRKGDVRIMVNLKNDVNWMETLLHELGHSVYSKYIDRDLPFILRTSAHTFTTEATAMFFGRLARNPNWMKDMGIITDEEKEKIASTVKKILRLTQLVFARWAQVMFRFERELYNNPDQNLNELWWETVEAYQFVQPPENREKSADWATKIHICSYPVYYHNYMLGELFASQLHYYIVNNVFKIDSDRNVSYVGRIDAGKYLREKLFLPGAKYRWDDLIKKITGEPLTPKYFVNQFIH